MGTILETLDLRKIKREITLPQALYALLALVIQECWVIGPFYRRERFI